MSAAFNEIITLDKRCRHFVPDACVSKVNPNDAIYFPPPSADHPLSVTARNYALMQSLTDTLTERLSWQSACAAAFNRYIDKNRVDGDIVAKNCLRWWRAQIFFAPHLIR